MNTVHLVLSLLLLALAAPVAPPAAAAGCSPIPHVVDVRCPPVPFAGAVAISNVVGFGLQTAVTPGFACGPLTTLSASVATIDCTPLTTGPCVNPSAFAMSADLAHGLGVTAQCGSATATCSAAGGSFCFGFSAALDAYPITCTVDVGPAALTDFTWWVQCSAPV